LLATSAASCCAPEKDSTRRSRTWCGWSKLSSCGVRRQQTFRSTGRVNRAEHTSQYPFTGGEWRILVATYSICAISAEQCRLAFSGGHGAMPAGLGLDCAMRLACITPQLRHVYYFVLAIWLSMSKRGATIAPSIGACYSRIPAWINKSVRKASR
jgi:hypothetical protein